MDSTTNEFRRGWRVLVASSLGVALGASPIPFNSLGPLTVPLTREFGWGRGDVQLGILIFTLAVILLVPVVGGIADRIGVRKVALFTLAAFGVMFAALSLTPASLPVFYLLYFLTGALGGYSTPVSWTRAVNGWFVQRRGLALALCLMGTGLTAAFLPAYTNWLIEHFGWRTAYAALGLLPLVIALPVAFAWFRDPTARDLGLQPAGDEAAAAAPVPREGVTLSQALRDYRFWVLAIAIFLVATGVAGCITNFVPLLVDRGFAAQEAANIAGAIGITIIAGRIVAGYLIDRIWAPSVTFPMLLAPAVAALLLASSHVTPTTALVAAVMIGLASGAETDLVAYLSARYFGLAHYGKIYGVQYSLFGLASGIAPFIFGAAFDRYGGYQTILYIAAGAFLTGALLLLTMGRYPSFARAESHA